MGQVELNAEIREKSGKGVARKLRAEGKLPAVVYGKGIESKAIIVDPNELNTLISGESGWNTLISLKGIPELSKEVVVLKDASFHAIRRNFTSADFHIMNLKEKSSFMVPVNVVGTSAGQKMGGSLELIRKELEVFCLPTGVPQSVDIDITALEIGDNLHIEEIEAPEGAELVHEVNFTVLTIVAPQLEEVDADEESEEDEGVAEVAADGEEAAAE